MFYIKNMVFIYLTARQKSMLLSYIRSFVKKNSTLQTEDIIDKFFEDETYFKNVGNPHFEFVLGYFEDENFIKDLKIYINSIFKEIEEKERMRPLVEKQKEFQKEQRKRAQEWKMSKLKPTKKQLFYYEKVARAHNVEMKDTKDASRLDLRNWIMEIIDDNKTADD